MHKYKSAAKKKFWTVIGWAPAPPHISTWRYFHEAQVTTQEKPTTQKAKICANSELMPSQDLVVTQKRPMTHHHHSCSVWCEKCSIKRFYDVCIIQFNAILVSRTTQRIMASLVQGQPQSAHVQRFWKSYLPPIMFTSKCNQNAQDTAADKTANTTTWINHTKLMLELSYYYCQ